MTETGELEHPWLHRGWTTLAIVGLGVLLFGSGIAQFLFAGPPIHRVELLTAWVPWFATVHDTTFWMLFVGPGCVAAVRRLRRKRGSWLAWLGPKPLGFALLTFLGGTLTASNTAALLSREIRIAGTTPLHVAGGLVVVVLLLRVLWSGRKFFEDQPEGG